MTTSPSNEELCERLKMEASMYSEGDPMRELLIEAVMVIGQQDLRIRNLAASLEHLRKNP